jgi:3-deoxy-D-arabino-heptulosonate 7-phosphate (DAHP) synthase
MKTITIVTWDDAWQDQENFSTPHGMRATHEPMKVVTMGTVVVDDESGISMACEESSQDGHAVYRGRTFIPRAMIRSVETFNLTKQKKKKAVEAKASTAPQPGWEFFCEHANEVPVVCPCPPTCGCRQAHCHPASS